MKTLGTPPTRQTQAPRKRGDDTRARIIDETVRCVVEEGFPAATAKHVAERAGVTWGVIQYHFGDRDGLLMAVVDEGVARLLESLGGADVGDLPCGSVSRSSSTPRSSVTAAQHHWPRSRSCGPPAAPTNGPPAGTCGRSTPPSPNWAG